MLALSFWPAARNCLVLVFVALASSTAILGVPQSPSPAHTLFGTVLDPSSSNIVGANVTLVGTNGQIVTSKTTDGFASLCRFILHLSAVLCK
jgi:hypothetical protein